jgi:hypothetical protein
LDRPSIAGRRIVKHFDFDERRLGNYESVPMSWRRHGGTGFPVFIEGRIDDTTGHAAAPSFRLDLDGGSLGYHFEGRDISVRTNSDYLVVGWVKARSLETTRAYLTACYLDRKGVVIPGTERRSELVGGQPDIDWRPITVPLPGNIPGSRYIGLDLWLTQSEVWNTDAPPIHHAAREDVKATAWFDDITVFRLPRVTLGSAHPGNAFLEGEPVELQTEVNDPDGLSLTATLTLTDVQGVKIAERPVPIRAQGSGFERFRFDDLPVGLYGAELVVSSEATVLVSRRLTFIRLPATLSPPQSSGRNFGAILNDVSPTALAGQAELLKALHVEHVKVPVWSPQLASAPNSAMAELKSCLEAVVSASGEPIGVLTDRPILNHGVASDGQRTRPLMDILNDDPAGWRPLIAGTWSLYAGLIPIWQLGADGESVGQDPRTATVLPVLRREMAPLMGHPVLALGATVGQARGPSSADYQSILVPASIPTDCVGEYLRAAAVNPFERTWAVVQPISKRNYSRELWLGDLARRVVEARFAGPAAVFLPAPWSIRADALSAEIVPREELILFRTIADVLGRAVPVSRSAIDGQARCLTFDRNGRAILFVWDPDAPAEGRDHVLYLGPEAQTIDMWGHVSTPAPVGNEQLVRIGPTPQFIVNTPTWLFEFRRQFSIDPPDVEASFDPCERSITFRNTYREPINGMLRLVPPPDWDIRPNRIMFSLAPGQQFRQQIAIRFPVNAEAGLTPLVGEFTLDADHRYRVISAAWLELGLKNIVLETESFRRGTSLVVRQSLANNSSETVSFSGYLLAPQRERIERSFWNFQPGQTAAKEFVLENADALAGQKIRLSLKEMQGTRVWNRVLTVR